MARRDEIENLPTELWDWHQVATYLHCGRTRVFELAQGRNPEIDTVRIAGKRLFPRVSVEDYVRREFRRQAPERLLRLAA